MSINDNSTYQPADTVQERYTWRPLRLFALYRLLVGIMLVAGFATGIDPLLFDSRQPVLFLQISIIYLTAALVLLAVAYQVRQVFSIQVCSHALIDIVCLSSLIYAAGSPDPGLAGLLLVAVAVGGVLVTLRMAALFAAAASLTLFFLEFLAGLDSAAETAGYAQVGVFGLALFVVTLGGNRLARGARESHALAEQRGEHLADQEALNRHIVQRLPEGVLVLDRDDRVRLVNATTWDLMGRRPGPVHNQPLERFCPALARSLTAWREAPLDEPTPIQAGATAPQLQPRFQPLKDAPGGGTVVFLEDLAERNARVQQAKLVSLGRLTASIAHEIRNPLSAITHAGQLLDEAELSDADRRLVAIIQRHGQRLNTIVENVLGLSRRRQPNQQAVDVPALLAELDRDLASQPELQPLVLDHTRVPDGLTVVFDRDQFHQVLSNLLANAGRHARRPDRELTVTLTAGTDERGQPYLDLCDNGPGIGDADLDQLFDPFFTTAGDGTGLGLYLCRELCEANHARLGVQHTGDDGTCFRITFAGTQEVEP